MSMMTQLAKLTPQSDLNVYYTNQFHNRDAQTGYAKIGEEIARELPQVDAFCGMVGTSGISG